MNTETCIICNKDLNELSELNRILHINSCLDETLEPLLSQVSISNQALPEFPEELPDYDNMNAVQLKNELDKWGMKKNFDIKTAKHILKQTWMYLNKGVFPEFLKKYLE